MAASRQLTCAMGTVGEAVNAHPSSNDRKVVGFRPIRGKEEKTDTVHHIGRIETTADPTPPPSPPPRHPIKQTIGSPVDRPVQASTPSHPSHPLLIHLTDKIGSGYPRKMKKDVKTQTLGMDLVKRPRWGSGGQSSQEESRHLDGGGRHGDTARLEYALASRKLTAERTAQQTQHTTSTAEAARKKTNKTVQSPTCERFDEQAQCTIILCAPCLAHAPCTPLSQISTMPVDSIPM